MSIKKMARELNVDRTVIENYIKSTRKTSVALKKQIFTILLILIPVLFFVLLEIFLRLFHYGGDLNLFVNASEGYSDYHMCNPQVGHRFFYQQESAPSPPLDLFLKEKTANSFRIFVLGGSTTAGYPYGNNLMFTRILQHRLSGTFPNRKIELVNTAMAAINSYAYVDYIDEILEQEPDALLVYGGHNEFYGVLGIASSQNLGRNRTVKLAYLHLKNFKTFLLLRDMITSVRGIFSSAPDEAEDPLVTATMMERLVGEQQIIYDSEIYRQGRDQFVKNLEIILKKCRQNHVPVIISDLVSNIKDQPPFISLTSDHLPEAGAVYKEAFQLQESGQFDAAGEKYLWAKDLDALRFRATEDFNDEINKLAAKYNMPVVSMKSAFESDSPHGLVGDNLMLEHLHPNIKGYFLMAEAFYNKIVELNLIKNNPDNPQIYYLKNILQNQGYTELDSAFGDLRIRILKGGWPFKEKAAPNKALEDYRPVTRAESLAVSIWSYPEHTLERGHVELAEFFEQSGQFKKAYREYLALIALTPYNVSPYLRAADALLKLQALEEALPLLNQSLQIEATPFAHKWIGQILLGENQLEPALDHLETAYKKLPSDPQLLYNLAGAYALDQQYYQAKAILDILLRVSPNFPGIQLLSSQVNRLLEQQDT